MTKVTVDHDDVDGAALTRAALTTHAPDTGLQVAADAVEADVCSSDLPDDHTAPQGDAPAGGVADIIAAIQAGDDAALTVALDATTKVADDAANNPAVLTAAKPAKQVGETKKQYAARIKAWQAETVKAATPVIDAVVDPDMAAHKAAIEAANVAVEADKPLHRTMPMLVSTPVIMAQPATPVWPGGLDLSGWADMAADTAWQGGLAPPCPDVDAVHAACALSAGNPDNGVPRLSEPHTKKVMSIACYLTQAMPQHLDQLSTFNVFDWGVAMHMCRSLGRVCGTTADNKQNASLDAERAMLLSIDRGLSVQHRYGTSTKRGVVYRNRVTTTKGYLLVTRYFDRINRPVPLWLSGYHAAVASWQLEHQPAKPVDGMAALMGAPNTK